MRIKVEIFINNVLAVISLSIAIFIFLPLTVYSFNPYSVSVKIQTILQGGLIVGSATALVIIFLSCLPKIGNLLVAACQVATVTTFVLVVFPNRTGEITGFENSAVAVNGFVPYAKIVVIFLAGVLAAWKWPRHFKSFSLIVLALTILVSGYVAIFQRSSADSHVSEGPEEQDYAINLGKDKNIFIIVTDGFTGFRMVEVFEERPEFKKSFTGFTLYPKTIASALNTPAGISAILTGDLEVAINIENRLERNTQILSRSFLQDAIHQGFESVIITSLWNTTNNQDIISLSDMHFIDLPSCQPTNDLLEYTAFLTTSLARILPHNVHKLTVDFVRKYFMRHSTDQIPDIQRYKNMGPGNERKTFGSKIALEYIINNMKIADMPRKALFLHTNISHPPYIFDEDGHYDPGADSDSVSIFTTKMIIRFLDKLRDIGLYDSSLIVIVADHGGMSVKDSTMGGVFEDGPPLHLSFNPLLMVKIPDSKHPLRNSEMSVWLGDVAETIRHFFDKTRQPDESGSYSIRSLMYPDDSTRKLNVPLFLKSRQQRFHSALAEWTKVNVYGTFQSYGAASNPIDLFRPGAKVTLFAGVDRLRTQQVRGGWISGIGIQYRAAIDVDGIVVTHTRHSGIVALINLSGKLEKFEFRDLQEAISFMQGVNPNTILLAAGLHLSVSAINELFPNLPTQDFEESARINFVFASLPRFKNKPMLEVCTDDVTVTLKWEEFMNLPH